MAVDESHVPVFLGVSTRAARQGFAWDLLGLSNVVVFPFFPQTISGLQVVLGLPRIALAGQNDFSYRVILTDELHPENQGFSTQEFTSSEAAVPTATVMLNGSFSVPSTPAAGGSAFYGLQVVQSEIAEPVPGFFELIATPAPPLILVGPTRVNVDIEMGRERFRRGTFVCGFAVPPPLTDEERRALMSRASTNRHMAATVGCSKCDSKLSLYLNLDPNAPRPSKGPIDAIALHEIPGIWKCGCGKSEIDMSYLKAGFHELLRHMPDDLRTPMPVQFTPLYEAGRIRATAAEYDQLIETAAEEETVQKYLEQHPLFWSFLSPARILHKPPVLTKKKADFGILTSHKILYLVEIEKPTTRLTNQDESISAEIQAGANQIRDWQLVVTDHRLALLSELGIRSEDVHEIRYLLVGGLARRTPGTGLTKLRRTPFAPNTEFYCFDELGSFLNAVQRELPRL